MKTITSTLFVVFVAFAIIYALTLTDEPVDLVGDRWYTETQLVTGKQVYDNNCIACHGAQGQGLAEDWRQPLADGSYPPPPLNGTAHTWHHPGSQLLLTINQGGAPVGGKMPAFESKLTEKEKLAVMAYFQNWWSDEVYTIWIERDGLNF